jgi:hypothetical protein
VRIPAAKANHESREPRGEITALGLLRKGMTACCLVIGRLVGAFLECMNL